MLLGSYMKVYWVIEEIAMDVEGKNKSVWYDDDYLRVRKGKITKMIFVNEYGVQNTICYFKGNVLFNFSKSVNSKTQQLQSSINICRVKLHRGLFAPVILQWHSQWYIGRLSRTICNFVFKFGNTFINFKWLSVIRRF